MTDYENLLNELKIYRRIRVDQLDANMTDVETINSLAALQGAITAVEAVIAEPASEAEAAA